MMISARLLPPPSRRSATLMLTALMALVALPAPGATVYKSVGADGTVRYSDKPPPDNSPTEEIHLPDRPPVTLPDTRSLMEQMAATTDRLKADRLEREAARQPPASQAQPVDYPQPVQQSYSRPWLWGYEAAPQGRDHRHRQRPEREPPDMRNQRDRDRADREGTWYIPKRLPDLGPSRR